MAVKRFRRVAGNAAVVMEVSSFFRVCARRSVGACCCRGRAPAPCLRRDGLPATRAVRVVRWPAYALAVAAEGMGWTAAARTRQEQRRRRENSAAAALSHVSPSINKNPSLPQAKRRRQFENSQDKAKRKLKEVRMRRSKCVLIGWGTSGRGNSRAPAGGAAFVATKNADPLFAHLPPPSPPPPTTLKHAGATSTRRRPRRRRCPLPSPLHSPTFSRRRPTRSWAASPGEERVEG